MMPVSYLVSRAAYVSISPLKFRISERFFLLSYVRPERTVTLVRYACFFLHMDHSAVFSISLAFLLLLSRVPSTKLTLFLLVLYMLFFAFCGVNFSKKAPTYRFYATFTRKELSPARPTYIYMTCDAACTAECRPFHTSDR